MFVHMYVRFSTHFKAHGLSPRTGGQAIAPTFDPLNHGLQSRPPSPKRAERKVRRRPFREAGSGQNNGTR